VKSEAGASCGTLMDYVLISEDLVYAAWLAINKSTTEKLVAITQRGQSGHDIRQTCCKKRLAK
jgi:hypothetical protein